MIKPPNGRPLVSVQVCCDGIGVDEPKQVRRFARDVFAHYQKHLVAAIKGSEIRCLQLRLQNIGLGDEVVVRFWPYEGAFSGDIEYHSPTRIGVWRVTPWTLATPNSGVSNDYMGIWEIKS